MCKFDECSKRSEGLFCKKHEPPADIIKEVKISEGGEVTVTFVHNGNTEIITSDGFKLNSVSEIIKNILSKGNNFCDYCNIKGYNDRCEDCYTVYCEDCSGSNFKSSFGCTKKT
jgi:hypothetical protein